MRYSPTGGVCNPAYVRKKSSTAFKKGIFKNMDDDDKQNALTSAATASLSRAINKASKSKRAWHQSTYTFSVEHIPAQWKQIFKDANVTTKMLETPETANAVAIAVINLIQTGEVNTTGLPPLLGLWDPVTDSNTS